jgi:hypothetical protein
MDAPVYLNEKEVSKLAKRAVNTLRADRHYGRGLPYRKNGRQILYRLDEVLQHLERNKIETTDSRG